MPGESKELYAGHTNEIYLSVSWELPGGPEVKSASTAGSVDLLPGQGTKIPHAVQCYQI